MKYRTLLPLALLALAATAQAEDTLEKVARTGKITLAYRESSIPFSYLVGADKPVGMGVDISQAVVAEVKKALNKPALEVDYVAVTSANRIPLVQNGTVDLECGSTTNNSARAKDVTFAINYFYTGTRLLTKKSSGIKGYADLAGKQVSSTSGTTNVQVLRKFDRDHSLNMQMVYGKDHAESMLLVESGRAVAFGMDDILLYGLKAAAKDPGEWDVVGEALQVEPYACMLRKDDPRFKALVDKVIGDMMKSGDFAKLYAKWFTSPIPPNNNNLGAPMSDELKGNLKALSDKPAT
ncbi:amino acid ABC transporter substrate-binding protein [Ramlibacter agri]|uniref:amino acid ABC transporter substrate-binding protein n=1 Tax=Ramlibacter agri TaxID=2728837 RepID=UPI001F116C71|nr:amino acid ABC transporter substrate-binding protein [Ramlibacter agri]